MPKYRVINGQAFFRMLLVGSLAAGVCGLGGILLSNLLDYMYLTSYSNFWQELFYLFSSYRWFIVLIVFLAGIALFGGWVMAPVFSAFAGVVERSLKLSDEQEELHLPKSLRELEDTLNGINKELRLWKYAVQEAEQRKDDLVVYLAHDIRTPLTSVLGYLEVLEDHTDLPAESREKYIGIALRKARRMQMLVEELFEITRFNVGEIELMRQEVSAQVLVMQLTEEIAPQLKDRNITMRLRNSGVGTIFVDPDKIARALDNILVNAARYTPEGGEIEVVLDLVAERPRIRISNTGAEIPPERLARFFEKFYRGDEARSSGTGGSGLGLAIAKNLIEAHGGSISAASEHRVTTFTVLL